MSYSCCAVCIRCVYCHVDAVCHLSYFCVSFPLWLANDDTFLALQLHPVFLPNRYIHMPYECPMLYSVFINHDKRHPFLERSAKWPQIFSFHDPYFVLSAHKRLTNLPRHPTNCHSHTRKHFRKYYQLSRRRLMKYLVLGLRGVLCAMICPLILTLDLCRGPIGDWEKTSTLKMISMDSLTPKPR